jgi:hypothetical protein
MGFEFELDLQTSKWSASNQRRLPRKGDPKLLRVTVEGRNPGKLLRIAEFHTSKPNTAVPRHETGRQNATSTAPLHPHAPKNSKPEETPSQILNYLTPEPPHGIREPPPPPPQAPDQTKATGSPLAVQLWRRRCAGAATQQLGEEKRRTQQRR